eukprot:12881399-Prorocentrum_lima.AAC.1
MEQNGMQSLRPRASGCHWYLQGRISAEAVIGRLASAGGPTVSMLIYEDTLWREVHCSFS